jgi:methylthioxylose transferase
VTGSLLCDEIAETPAPDATRRGVTGQRAAVLAAVALVSWAALIAVGRAWGWALMGDGHRITLFTPPILGGYRVAFPTAVWIPLLVGGLLVVLLPRLAVRLAWRPLLWTGALAAVAWWVAVAFVDGTAELTRGLFWDADYATAVPGIADHPLAFLRGFVAANPGYGIAMRAHPPGLPLAFGLLERLGMGGAGWAAVLVYASAASSVPAVLVAVRAIVDEESARRALPFVVLAPAAIWIGTSTDALYLGPTAWLVALIARATTSSGRRSDALAVAAGALAFVVALLSYGLVLMAIPLVVIAVHRRMWRPLVIAAGVAGGLLALLVPLGYGYVAGYFATKHAYDTFGLDRPATYFLVNNVAAWCLTIGPATAVAIVWLRDRRLWVLVGGSLGAVIAADLSGLSKGEVERIWLPFTLWVLAAGAVFGEPVRRVPPRLWLGLQVVTTVVILCFVRANW